MKKITNFLLAGLFMFFVASPALAVTAPAAQVNANCETTILGIPPWYRGLTEGTDCRIAGPQNSEEIAPFVWRIVLNVIQMGLTIAGYIAFFFIIYGGFLFITGGSNPSQVEKGRKAIFNAVIGLVIALGAIAITNLIFEIVAPRGNVGQVEGIAQMSGAQLLTNILNMVYFLVGTIAVVVIIISGASYITASGDSGKITRAKNMLTYSIVGLVIVILAFAITGFVIRGFAS